MNSNQILASTTNRKSGKKIAPSTCKSAKRIERRKFEGPTMKAAYSFLLQQKSTAAPKTRSSSRSPRRKPKKPKQIKRPKSSMQATKPSSALRRPQTETSDQKLMNISILTRAIQDQKKPRGKSAKRSRLQSGRKTPTQQSLKQSNSKPYQFPQDGQKRVIFSVVKDQNLSSQPLTPFI